MPLADIDNATFDGVAAAVPGPFGPLTRVTDLETNVVSPNSQMPVRVTSVLDVAFDISYDEMNDTDMLNKRLHEAHGALYVYYAMCQAITVLYAHITVDLSTVTPAMIYTFLAAMRNLDSLYAMVPHQAAYEYDHNLDIVADFTATDGTDGTADFDQTITGDVDWFAWDFGDANDLALGITEDPTHDYGAADTYTVSLIVMGRGSRFPVVVTKDVVVTGP